MWKGMSEKAKEPYKAEAEKRRREIKKSHPGHKFSQRGADACKKKIFEDYAKAQGINLITLDVSDIELFEHYAKEVMRVFRERERPPPTSGPATGAMTPDLDLNLDLALDLNVPPPPPPVPSSAADAGQRRRVTDRRRNPR